VHCSSAKLDKLESSIRKLEEKKITHKDFTAMTEFVLQAFTAEIRMKVEIHVSKCSSCFVFSILGSRSKQSPSVVCHSRSGTSKSCRITHVTGFI